MKSLGRMALLVVLLAAGLPAFGQKIITARGAVITETQGRVLVQIGASSPVIGRQGTALPAGSVILTDPGASAIIAYPDAQISVIGERSIFRIVDYRYDPAEIGKSTVSLNLVSGSVRLIMGEIGQLNPSAVRVQIGMASLGVTTRDDRGTDASVVVEGGPVAVTVQRGQVEVLLPSGAPQQIGAGQAMYLAQDGTVRRGTMAQVVQQLGAAAQDVQTHMAMLQGYDQKILQTVVTLSAVSATLKDPEAAPAALTVAERAAAQEILKQLENMPPTASIDISQTAAAPAPTLGSGATPTPGSSGGGGTACPASCN